MLQDDALREAARILRAADEVTLVCHVNPDADAIGSMLGLAVHLAGQGKRVAAASPNKPDELPRWVSALPRTDLLVAPSELPDRPAVLVTLDAADRERLADLMPLLERAGTVICVDHHRTNDGFGTVNLVDPDAAATAEVVFRLIKAMDSEPDADAAACLYAGLVTDTGRFQYEAATPEVLRVAAELREQGFDHVALSQALYADGSVGFLRLLGVVLARVEHVEEADLIWTHLLRRDLDEAGVEIQETDDLIDIVRVAREADVAAVVKEQAAGGFKVSLRSRGGTDVAQVAGAFGGGGHRLAAGYTSNGSLDETRTALLEALVQVNPASAAP